MTDLEQIAGECDCEQWPPRQTGGQVVGPGPQGVKITHRDTGLVACCGVGRSQHINRSIAFDMILSALTHPRISK